MFISISSFVIANDMVKEVQEAFHNRPHLVDKAPGFVRMEVFSPQANPHEFWLMSYWTDEESFKAWYKTHHYHDAHAGIPKGVKLVPNSVSVRYFHQF
jgi:heme-degrading monooxygenase HmoA